MFSQFVQFEIFRILVILFHLFALFALLFRQKARTNFHDTFLSQVTKQLNQKKITNRFILFHQTKRVQQVHVFFRTEAISDTF